MPRIKSGCEYAKQQVQEGVFKFNVKGARLGFGWFDRLIMFPVIAIVALYVKFWILPVIALYAYAIPFNHKRNKSKNYEFTVSEKELTIDGRSIPARDIHRLIIRHCNDNKPVTTTVLVGSTGHVAAISAFSQFSAYGRAKLSSVGYSVDVEFQGKALTIGGGLDEVAAYGLMRDVAAVLGLSQ